MIVQFYSSRAPWPEFVGGESPQILLEYSENERRRFDVIHGIFEPPLQGIVDTGQTWLLLLTVPLKLELESLIL